MFGSSSFCNTYKIKEEKECNCQPCMDKHRLQPENYLKPEMISAFLLLWVSINHSLASTNYVQNESIVWFALLDILIWNSDVKQFTKASIELYRTTLLPTLNIYYQFFSPKALTLFEITYKIPGAGVPVCNIISTIDPSLFHKWLKKDPRMLVLNILSFAKEILSIDKNSNFENHLAIMLSRYINPNLFFNTNSDGKLTLPDIGFIKPWNGHSGVTITSVVNYKYEHLIDIIITLLSSGNKVRIVKEIADDFFFKKNKNIIRINTRFFFFTHMLEKVKKD
jgi:hypothetical protein